MEARVLKENSTKIGGKNSKHPGPQGSRIGDCLAVRQQFRNKLAFAPSWASWPCVANSHRPHTEETSKCHKGVLFTDSRRNRFKSPQHLLMFTAANSFVKIEQLTIFIKKNVRGSWLPYRADRLWADVGCFCESWTWKENFISRLWSHSARWRWRSRRWRQACGQKVFCDFAWNNKLMFGK